LGKRFATDRTSTAERGASKAAQSSPRCPFYLDARVGFYSTENSEEPVLFLYAIMNV